MKTFLPLLFTAVAITIAPAAAPPSTSSRLVNGDFTASPPGKVPAGWVAAYPDGEGVVFSDGKDTFLRLSSRDGRNAGMAQKIQIPPKSTAVLVLGHMRGRPDNEKTERRAAVEIALRYQDAKGANLNAAVVASRNSPNWHTFRREFKLPAGATTIEVVARSIFAVGTFDFDEVRVDFK